MWNGVVSSLFAGVVFWGSCRSVDIILLLLLLLVFFSLCGSMDLDFLPCRRARRLWSGDTELEYSLIVGDILWRVTSG